MIWYLIGAAVLVAFSFLGYGVVFAYFQKEYPVHAKTRESEDRKIAMATAMGGPLLVLSALIFCGTKHGLMYRSPSRGENPYE